MFIMTRRPRRSPLLPYTTLFRSAMRASACSYGTHTAMWIAPPPSGRASFICSNQNGTERPRGSTRSSAGLSRRGSDPSTARRSGEGRVGEEGRYRWAPDPLKKKKELRAEHGYAAADVTAIEIAGNERMPGAKNIPCPADEMMAQDSVPFCVALAHVRDPQERTS